MSSKILNDVKLNITPAPTVTTPTQIGTDGDPTKSENIAVTLAKIAGWYEKMTDADEGNSTAFTGDAKSVNGVEITCSGALKADSVSAATELTFTNAEGGENTIKLQGATYTADGGIKLESGNFSHSNSIDASTTEALVKIAFDEQGHITSISPISEDDIPSLSTSKITSGTFDDERIASSETWNAKQDALTFETEPSETNKVATMVDVENATSSITSVMHFVGVKDEIPSDGTFADGDVICVGHKEYVYDSSKGETISDHWILLGDEGSYALNTITIKGDNGLSGSGKLTGDITISHNTKSSDLEDLVTEENKFISGLTFDDYGHITGYSVDEITPTTYSLSGEFTSDGWVTTLSGSDDSNSTSTVPIMVGATDSESGTAGVVPTPTSNDNNSFLRGDGTWSSDPVVSSDTLIINCIA